MVTGSVNITNRGFNIALKIAKTRATIIAVHKLTTSTPGKTFANTITAIALNSIFKITFILFLFKLLCLKLYKK